MRKYSQTGSTVAVNATNFYIYPRIFLASAADANWWLFWKSANDVPTASTIHADFYNEDEVKHSAIVPLDDELELVNVVDVIPDIWTAYPYSGYVNLTWTTTTPARQALEILGWSYLQATGTASESWTVMTPMWRDVDY